MNQATKRVLTPETEIARDFERLLIGAYQPYQPNTIVVNMARPIMEVSNANGFDEITALKLMVLEYHRRFNERFADEVEQARTCLTPNFYIK